jgi:hypothetical protein
MALADRLGVFELAAYLLVVKVVLGLARLLVNLARLDETLLRLIVFSRSGAISFAFITLLREFIFPILVHVISFAVKSKRDSLPAGSRT